MSAVGALCIILSLCMHCANLCSNTLLISLQYTDWDHVAHEVATIARRIAVQNSTCKILKVLFDYLHLKWFGCTAKKIGIQSLGASRSGVRVERKQYPQQLSLLVVHRNAPRNSDVPFHGYPRGEVAAIPRHWAKSGPTIIVGSPLNLIRNVIIIKYKGNTMGSYPTWKILCNWDIAVASGVPNMGSPWPKISAKMHLQNIYI